MKFLEIVSLVLANRHPWEWQEQWIILSGDLYLDTDQEVFFTFVDEIFVHFS